MNFFHSKWVCSGLILLLLFLACQKKGVEPNSDRIPPEVVSVFPKDQAREVDVNASLQITFNESVRANSVRILLEEANASTSVSGNTTVTDTLANFQPNSPLQYSTTYRATVKAGVKDRVGNAMKKDYSWSFTTISAPDTIPPQVVSTIPADGAANVPPNIQVKVVFSESVHVPTDGFSLRDENGAYIAGGRFISGSTFTFTPRNPLHFSATYTATITTAVMDLAGNHLAQDYTFSFTVEPDDVPPQVVETYPADGDTGVAKDTYIRVVFDEPIDPASINAATFAVAGPNGNVSGNYFVSNDTARFAPDSLDWETVYTVTLSGITDLSGNPMVDYTFSFTTQADTTPRWTLVNGGMKRLAITENGIVYALGGSQTLNAPVVVKFNTQGKIVWIKPLPNYVGYNRDIAVYSGGGQDEVYVLTAQYHPLGGGSTNITKLDGSGNIVWTSSDFTSNAYKLEVSTDGRLFIPNGRLYEFSTGNGSVIHIQDVGTNNSKILSVIAFADFIYVGGETSENLFAPNVSSDWFIAKYDANYNLIWGAQFNGPDSAAEFVGVVAVDRNLNRVYVGGGYGRGMSWVYDGIASYVDNGNSADFLWFQRVTNHTSAIGDVGTRMVAYNSSIYYGNSVPNTPVKVLSDGTIGWNMTSDGVEDFVFYNGKMYVIFPPPRSNKIFLFDAETGVPLN